MTRDDYTRTVLLIGPPRGADQYMHDLIAAAGASSQGSIRRGYYIVDGVCYLCPVHVDAMHGLDQATTTYLFVGGAHLNPGYVAMAMSASHMGYKREPEPIPLAEQAARTHIARCGS